MEPVRLAGGAYVWRGCGLPEGKRSASAFDDAHDVFFAHHQELVAVELHFGAGILAEQHAIADLHIQRAALAVVEDLALAHGDDLALDRLLGGGVRDHDAAGGRALFFHATDNNAVVQGTNLHVVVSSCDRRIGSALGQPMSVHPVSTHLKRVLIVEPYPCLSSVGGFGGHQSSRR
ncbi:hypothetical protein THIOKS12330042 [Thiocapsa sp. KS1]|nr:hypothetical protein THIOKS12330042 [Thiocapsa sp. KS1]